MNHPIIFFFCPIFFIQKTPNKVEAVNSKLLWFTFSACLFSLAILATNKSGLLICLTALYKMRAPAAYKLWRTSFAEAELLCYAIFLVVLVSTK